MPSSDQGVNSSRYLVVPRSLIFITRNDRVLLLKGANHKRLWAGLYNGVGGHIEQGEDPLSSARRELLEETGLSDIQIFLCGIVFVNPNTNPGVGIFIFTGESKNDGISGSEEGQLEWIDQSNLNDLPLVEDLSLLFPRILSFKPGSEPFIAHSWYDENQKLKLTFS